MNKIIQNVTVATAANISTTKVAKSTSGFYRYFATFALLFALLLSSSSVSGQCTGTTCNIVTNGDFSAGSLSGWTKTGAWTYGNVAGSTSTAYYDMNSVGNLSQSVSGLNSVVTSGKIRLSFRIFAGDRQPTGTGFLGELRVLLNAKEYIRFNNLSTLGGPLQVTAYNSATFVTNPSPLVHTSAMNSNGLYTVTVDIPWTGSDPDTAALSFNFTGGDDDFAIDDVTINRCVTPPTPTNTAVTTPCGTTTFDLSTLQPTTIGGITYEWHNVASNPTSGTQRTGVGITAAPAGTYYLYSKTTSGCYALASAPVVVTASVTPANPTATSGTIANNCPSATVNLTTRQPAAVAGTTYEWWTGTASSRTTQIATPTTYGTVGATTVFLWRKSDVGGCYSALGSPVTVTITTPPAAPTVGTITQPTCVVATGSVALSGLPASWTIIATSTSPSTITFNKTGTSATTDFAGLTAGRTYTFTVNGGTCISAPSTAAVINAQGPRILNPNNDNRLSGFSLGTDCGAGAAAYLSDVLPVVANATGYDDRTAAVPAAIIPIGTRFTATFSNDTGFGGNAGIWIDFDNDGEFESSENVLLDNEFSIGGNDYCSAGIDPIGGTFVMPCGTASGNYRMRIIATGDTQTIAASDGCGIFEGGSIADYLIQVQPVPVPTIVSTVVPTCTTATGTATLGNLPLGEFSVTDSFTGVTTVITIPHNDTVTFTNLAIGTHNFTVTSEGCTAVLTAQVLFNNPTASITSVTPSNPTTCSGTSGSLALNGLTNGTSYTINYKKGGIAQTAVVQVASGGAVTLTGLTAGSYTDITVTSGSCTSATTSATLSDPPTPAIPTATLTHPTCTVNTGTVTVNTPAGMDSYLLTGTSPVVAPVSNASGVFSGLNPGNYTIVATSAAGCSSTAQAITINEVPATPITTTSTLTQPTCTVLTGTVTVTAPTGMTSYSITGTNPVVAKITNASGIFTGLTAGTYDVIATNAEGCSSIAEQITINAATCVSVSGNVWEDANYNATKDGTEGNSLNLQPYANLVKNGLIEQVFAVNTTTGNYSFSNVSPSTAYKIILTTNAFNVGDPLTASGFPHSGSVNATGVNINGVADTTNKTGIIDINTTTANSTNQNFGIALAGTEIIKIDLSAVSVVGALPQVLPTTKVGHRIGVPFVLTYTVSSHTTNTQYFPVGTIFTDITIPYSLGLTYTGYDSTDFELIGVEENTVIFTGIVGKKLKFRSIVDRPVSFSSDINLHISPETPIPYPVYYYEYVQDPFRVYLASNANGVLLTHQSTTYNTRTYGNKMNVSGYVWNDSNADAIRATESFTNGGGLFANLVNGTTVLQSVPVHPTTGAYSFDIQTSTTNTIVIANSPTSLTSVLNSNWVHRGVNLLPYDATGNPTGTADNNPNLSNKTGIISVTTPPNSSVTPQGGRRVTVVPPTAVTGFKFFTNQNFGIAYYCTENPTGGTPDAYTQTGISSLEGFAGGWPENIPNGFIAIESKDKGFVITRIAASDIPTSDLVEGMLIYDTVDQCIKLYNGTNWSCIQRACND